MNNFLDAQPIHRSESGNDVEYIPLETEAEEYEDEDNTSIPVKSNGEEVVSAKVSIRQTPTKQSVLKILSKYTELLEAPKNHVRLLACALGVKKSPNQVCALICSSHRVDVSALETLLALAKSESPYEAILKAMSLTREETRNVWGLLVELNERTGSIPSKESSAAVSIAELSAMLGDKECQALESTVQLAKK